MSADLARFVPTVLAEARIPGIVHVPGTQHPVTRTVVGDRDSVAAVIRNHLERGTLVEHGVQVPVRGPGRRVRVKITYLESAAERAHALACHPQRPRWKTPAIVAGILAAAALIVWGVLQLVSAIMQSLPFLVTAIVVLIALSGAVAGIAHKCAGMHCDGCG